jgi:hypothetical protein
MDAVLARKMWRTLEPFHGFVYFADEAQAAFAAAGLSGDRMGYFASRSAAMGAVPADVVIATFYNFHPDLVRRCIPEAWSLATPDAVLSARLEAVDAGLRRMLGADVESPAMAEAAGLARRAAEHCPPAGRALFAGHASLPWPDAPHLVLWHAITLLREFRGDGHIAALVADDVGACQALVVHGATGDVPPAVLQSSRAWPDDEWAVAVAELRSRGWLDDAGALTATGKEHRQWVEDRTDALALAPWRALGQDGADRLRGLVRPFSQAVVASGELVIRPDRD